ncbi:ATP-binding cassette domain-containing protein [Spongiactinospora sp. 9N601]|uniref:ATP-binding cassette domain-containing protein n=1 Tax=Spongiactinospora sp. 9N601 TaxID=3375149 RepID=UPI0037BBEEBB
MTPRADAVLAARAIRKSFGGVTVLHGVDLDLRPGRVLALLGENGAGKSTLVKIIAGDHRPDSGQILIDGQAVGALDPLRARRLGIRTVHQELSDAPALTVAENISLGRWPRRRALIDWAAVRGRARRILDDPGSPIATLSGGNQQKVLLARWLARDSRLLVLVELTRGVDIGAREEIYLALRRLAGRDGVAILVATSDYEEVVQLADRALVMSRGRVVADLSGDGITTAALTDAAGG